ncbi:MAG: hypothetical protein LBN32_00725 [Helicobacteraceae bacterium]|nr:hypothetical protein [Helicobacteraceae bacterium]
MTLLDSRKVVLKSIAKELNNKYFSLYHQLECMQHFKIDPKAIGRELEGLENMMSYVRTEAEQINRESVKEVAKEVATLWQGNGK